MYKRQTASDICEDHYEEGEGASTGCGYSGEKIGQTFPTLAAMIKHLASYYGLPESEADYDIDGNTLSTTKTVANHSEAQNGGWFEATAEEIAAWTEGKMKLYAETFFINFIRCA